MSTLRISDAPLLPDVDGTEKIPTGGRGDYAISVDQIKGHIFQDIGKELVGLGNVDNTSDLDKPVSTAQQAALNLKADKTYVDYNLDLKADKTNVYTRSETTLALSTKADLVNGIIPENQIPNSFNDVLEFTTPNLPLVGESGKIYVTTDNNKTWRWATNKYVEISGWNPDSVSKKLTLPTYYTKEAGVDPVTGVADGAYFNVRSTNDDAILDEYQNIGGVPTPSGKSYPSLAFVELLSSQVEAVANFTPLPFEENKTYELNTYVTLANGDIVKSTTPNNTNNPNVDMVGWGSNNNDVKHISMFESILSASQWLAEKDNRYVRLSADVTYNLDVVGNLYFSRFFCEAGYATVIVYPDTDLRFLNKVDGSDSLYLKNIKFIVLGKRSGVTVTTSKWVYAVDQRATSPIISVYIENIKAYALTDINNPDSWVDDVGKTRCVGFLPVEISESSFVRNVEHYGFRSFYSMRSSQPTANHHEENIIGYNCETNVSINKGQGFTNGYCRNIKIFNTPENKSYYYNMDNVSNVAGLDALLLEADHSGRCEVADIGGTYIHERSGYLQSKNLYIDNVSDVGSYSPLNTKQGSGTVRAKNIRGINTSSGGGKCPFYGWDDLEWDGFEISDDTKTSNIACTFSYGGKYTLKNGTIKNQASPFYLSTSEGKGITEITIDNVNLVDCYSSLRPNVWSFLTSVNGNLGKLTIKNQKAFLSISDPTIIFNNSGSFKSIQKVELENVSWISSNYPFDASDCPEIVVNNSLFKVLSNTTLYNAFTRLEAAANFKATTFDFKVDILQTTDSVRLPFIVRMKNMHSQSMVQCASMWSEIEASVPVLASGNTARRLAKLDLYSFEVTVSFGQSQYKFVYDAETKVVTPIYNIGSKFSAAAESEKIAVYINASDGGLYVYPSSTWSGGAGNVSLKINRF